MVSKRKAPSQPIPGKAWEALCTPAPKKIKPKSQSKKQGPGKMRAENAEMKLDPRVDEIIKAVKEKFPVKPKTPKVLREDGVIPQGNPDYYTPELGQAVCDLIAHGVKIDDLYRLGGLVVMPSADVFYRWLVKYPDFDNMYFKAKQAQAERFAAEILDIADDGTNDFVEKEIANGRKVVQLDGEHVARSKLRIETRRWLMSKYRPVRYGERTALAVTGADGGPLKVQSTTLDPEKLKQLSDTELEAVLAIAEKLNAP